MSKRNNIEKKRKVSFYLSESILPFFNEVRSEERIPKSAQVELALEAYFRGKEYTTLHATR